MKSKLLHLLGLIMVLCSCSSAYRMGQTPDDVYFSPARPTPGYVNADRPDEPEPDGYAQGSKLSDPDMLLNGTVQDDSSLSLDGTLGSYPGNDDESLFFNPSSAAYYDPMYTGVTFYPYTDGSSFYLSFCNSFGWTRAVHRGSPKRPASYPGPRKFNLVAYGLDRNSPVQTTGPVNNPGGPARVFKKPAAATGLGNLIRRVFTPTNFPSSGRNDHTANYRGAGGNNNTPRRTFAPSSSSPGSSGGAATRTFRH